MSDGQQAPDSAMGELAGDLFGFDERGCAPVTRIQHPLLRRKVTRIGKPKSADNAQVCSEYFLPVGERPQTAWMRDSPDRRNLAQARISEGGPADPANIVERWKLFHRFCPGKSVENLSPESLGTLRKRGAFKPYGRIP